MRIIDLTLLDKVSSEAKECGISWSRLESGSVIFECKEGPFVPHEDDGILELPEK